MEVRDELLQTISLVREHMRTLCDLYRRYCLAESDNVEHQISAAIDIAYSEWKQQMKRFEQLHHRLREDAR